MKLISPFRLFSSPTGPEKATIIPFRIYRTASENIPVYLRWKNNRNSVSTLVFKIHGEKKALKSELSALCKARVTENARFFEIQGNHKIKVKQWLRGLGF